ncbi:endonuclease/exonuclease/phosphatase family protein [Erythrobacteraceae bacterium WH01K]|nr:endonuclease/exonuclease/phosphatase family protein [Erythrobacteraceae bacterium WH01K]
MELTFASYNIHKAVGVDRKRDPLRIIAVLREIDADIIALQEADLRFGARASVLPRAALQDTDWKVVDVAKRPQSIGWHGNALLVRRGIDIVHGEPLDLPTLEPRGAVCAELACDGKRFRVAGMHLDLSGLRRREQFHAVLKHLEDARPCCPEVLMGDFNQWQSQRGAIRAFGEEWRVLAPGPSFPSRRPVARLDRMVVSASWDVLSQDVHQSALSHVASDHLPICAKLRLP